jgi:formate dehydrogenase accessory protein FdhE
VDRIGFSPEMKAAQVGAGEYDARIRRAEYLASKHPFAAEVLRFYSRVAEFQKSFYAQLKKDVGPQLASLRGTGSLRARRLAGDADLLLSRLKSFLSLVGQAGPSTLAAAARDISRQDAVSHRFLLGAYWDLGGMDDQLIGAFAQFIPRAFTQPRAELLAAYTTAAPAVSTVHSCPLCGGQPLLGVLRPEGDGGKRRMMCSFCSQEWDFRRIYCHACGEADEKKLPVYVAEQFPHIRVEACETCKVYVRTIDLTKDGNAVPVVDDLAAIPLSLWAQEHGYTRLQPNLLGT